MMQTAKTLDDGESQWSLGVSAYSMEGDIGIAPDLMFRKGISDRSDFGIGYSMGLWGHARIDWKRVLKTNESETYYFSSGLGGDLYLPDDFGGDGPFIGVTLPFYYSFNHDGKLIPYFGQRFCLGLIDIGIVRHYGNDSPDPEEYRFNHYMYYSGAAGIRFGDKSVKWFLEASYNFSINHSYRHIESEEWWFDKGSHVDFNAQLTLGMMLGKKQ